MPWIQTYTGRVFDFNCFDPGGDTYFENPEACLTDICQSLSLINRYNGHTKFPYSVAHHSLNLAKCLPNLAIYALLHDCHEAYLGDIVAPVKNYLQPEYKELVERINRAIYRCFKIPYPYARIRTQINNYDLMIRRIERKYLMESAPIPWPEDTTPLSKLTEPPDFGIDPIGQETMRLIFWRNIVQEIGPMTYPWPEPSIFSFSS